MTLPDSEPLVSVFMAVYNGERYLKNAVESLLSQTYQNFEIIAVDDGSTDRSASILAGMADPRLKVVRSPANLGLTRSLIIARQHAAGIYFARQDADDLSHPERLARQVEHLRSNPGVGLVHADYEVIDARGRRLDTVVLEQQTGEALKSALVFGNIFAHGAVMFTRECYDAVGGYRSFMEVTQDYDLYLRISERAELANLPQILYSLRFHADSIGRSRREKQLAYQQLALDLAHRRRAGLPEEPILGDVAAAYPPDRSGLERDARGSAYLFYAAEETQLGERAVRRALALAPDAAVDPGAWEAWGVSKAHHLAQMTGSVDAGQAFIEWLTEIIRSEGIPIPARRWMAKYFADQAFQNHERGRRQDVIASTLGAVVNDYHWLSNRGLWKIALQALKPAGAGLASSRSRAAGEANPLIEDRKP